MNKVVLMGRLTQDPEVRYPQGNNTAYARYSLAVDRKRTQNGDQNTDFIRCVTFGKNAEFAEKYLHKGTKILVSGRIQTDNYTNREGKKVYTVEVVVDEHEFAESKNSSDTRISNQRQGDYRNTDAALPQKKSPVSYSQPEHQMAGDYVSANSIPNLSYPGYQSTPGSDYIPYISYDPYIPVTEPLRPIPPAPENISYPEQQDQHTECQPEQNSNSSDADGDIPPWMQIPDTLDDELPFK